jgi:anti-sigma-K factor RskA
MEPGLHELTAGYALDALDPEERDEYERHLAGCERCQKELASFWEVTGALALASDGPAPPPGLRERILEAARAEPQTVVPLDTVVSLDDARRRRRSQVLAAVAAIAAVVAIGLGIYAISLDNRLDDAHSALSKQEDIAAVLADPSATSVAMASGSGRLVVANDGSAVLVLGDLSAAPEGKTYQAWVVAGSTPASAGTFGENGGRAVVPIPQPVPDGAVVAVTVEDAGGADKPTLPILAASKPV